MRSIKIHIWKNGIFIILYSGHVVNQTSENIEKYKIQDDLDKYMREGKGPGYVFKYLTNEKKQKLALGSRLIG